MRRLRFSKPSSISGLLQPLPAHPLRSSLRLQSAVLPHSQPFRRKSHSITSAIAPIRPITAKYP